MGATVGREADALEFLAALAERPYRYDFYQTLRRLECLYPDRPRWGTALRPLDEPVRLGQEADLSFAAASLASLHRPPGRPPRVQVRLFGLLGPNGPLPLHITEYVRERNRSANDPTLGRFLDIFHHRFLALFYRAWAQAQPHVSRDRPDNDAFAGYVGSLLGLGSVARDTRGQLRVRVRTRDALPDVVKLFHAGALVRHVRNVEGLAAILRHYFRVPVRIQEFVGHWLRLGPRERTYLGVEGARLGSGAVAGARVWDRQHKFRIHVGPLGLTEYEAFLPSGSGRSGLDSPDGALTRLVHWVRLYLSFELDWDVRLHLRAGEVPRLQLGRRSRLAWTTWLGRRQTARDADDLCLEAERFHMTPGWQHE